MKNKSGFTLVELLAVIVVLAVLAVVAIPVVSDVIEAGKEDAAKNSAILYIDEVETNFSQWIIEGVPSGISQDKSESGYVKFDVIELNKVLKLDGKTPETGYVKINNDYSSGIDNHYYGYVVTAELKYDNNYTVTYNYHTEAAYEGDRTEITVKNEK